MGDRGSISVYWIIVILLVMKLILFALNISLKNHRLSSARAEFLEEAIYIENLTEQTKYLGYKLVEDAVVYAKNYTDYMAEFLDRELGDDELNSIYGESLEVYTDRVLKFTDEKGNIKSGTREKLKLMGYSEGYELNSLTVKARIIDEIELDDGKKRYKMVYDYYEVEGMVGYSSSPVVVEISYPNYDEVISKELTEAVKVYTANNYGLSE